MNRTLIALSSRQIKLHIHINPIHSLDCSAPEKDGDKMKAYYVNEGHQPVREPLEYWTLGHHFALLAI